MVLVEKSLGDFLGELDPTVSPPRPHIIYPCANIRDLTPETVEERIYPMIENLISLIDERLQVKGARMIIASPVVSAASSMAADIWRRGMLQDQRKPLVLHTHLSKEKGYVLGIEAHKHYLALGDLPNQRGESDADLQFTQDLACMLSTQGFEVSYHATERQGCIAVNYAAQREELRKFLELVYK